MRRTSLRILILAVSLWSSSYIQAFKSNEKKKKRPHETESDWMDRLREAMNWENEKVQERNETEYLSYMRLVMEKVLHPAFDLRTPKDVIDGAAAALANAMKAFNYVWSVPIVCGMKGWSRSGFIEMVKEGSLGVFWGAALSAGGMFASMKQLYAGIVQTPKAFEASSEGRTWDKHKAQWVFYSLDEEALEVNRLLAEEDETPWGGEGGPQLRKRSQVSVKDPSYYNMLKVPTDASPSEIKHAYRREALKVHPDKNKLDPSASNKFEELNYVYLTLVNEERRTEYDAQGAFCYEQDAVFVQSAKSEMDPYIFFATMFGSHLVEPYVGQLRIASLVDNLFELTKEGEAFFTKGELNADTLQQRKREINIAFNLREFIADFVGGKQSRNAFRIACLIEAENIANGDFGDIYLTSIGHAIEYESKKFLGSKKSLWGVRGAAFVVQSIVYDATMDTSVYWDLKSILRSFRTHQKKHAKKEDHECKSNSDSTMLEKQASNLFKLGWKVNTRDITATLRSACNKVIYDQGEPEKGLKRAEALGILGGEFFSVGKSLNDKQKAQHIHSDEEVKQWAASAALASAMMIPD